MLTDSRIAIFGLDCMKSFGLKGYPHKQEYILTFMAFDYDAITTGSP